MTKTEFLNLKEKLIRARQDGYAAGTAEGYSRGIEDAAKVVSAFYDCCGVKTNGDPFYRYTGDVAKAIKALLAKGTPTITDFKHSDTCWCQNDSRGSR